METNNKPLMKHFAAVLRKRALATEETNDTINPQILKFFTRKDLIQIITDKHKGTIPKEHNLVELENKELLELVGDDMFIISYMTKKWCQQASNKPVTKKQVVKPKPAVEKSKK